MLGSISVPGDDFIPNRLRKSPASARYARFLNGDSFSLADTSITLDDADFFENAPFTLASRREQRPI
jgi:hypothetical protein